jgi:hypothetical protein
LTPSRINGDIESRLRRLEQAILAEPSRNANQQPPPPNPPSLDSQLTPPDNRDISVTAKWVESSVGTMVQNDDSSSDIPRLVVRFASDLRTVRY